MILKAINKNLISIKIHFDNDIKINIINQRFALKYNL